MDNRGDNDLQKQREDEATDSRTLDEIEEEQKTPAYPAHSPSPSPSPDQGDGKNGSDQAGDPM